MLLIPHEAKHDTSCVWCDENIHKDDACFWQEDADGLVCMACKEAQDEVRADLMRGVKKE